MDTETQPSDRDRLNLSWLKQHERLLLIALALLVALWLGNKWLDHSADAALSKAAAAEEALRQTRANNQGLEKLVAGVEQNYQALVASLSAQNQQLAGAIAARSQAVVKQQAADQVLPLPELATRWGQLAPLAPGDIENVNGRLTVSEHGARQTVSQLELVPALEQNAKDQAAITANKDAQLGEQAKLVDAGRQETAGLKDEIAKADAACKAEVKSVKAQERKGKRNWFIYGVATGAALVAKVLL